MSTKTLFWPTAPQQKLFWHAASWEPFSSNNIFQSLGVQILEFLKSGTLDSSTIFSLVLIAHLIETELYKARVSRAKRMGRVWSTIGFNVSLETILNKVEPQAQSTNSTGSTASNAFCSPLGQNECDFVYIYVLSAFVAIYCFMVV